MSLFGLDRMSGFDRISTLVGGSGLDGEESSNLKLKHRWKRKEKIKQNILKQWHASKQNTTKLNSLILTIHAV